MVLCYTPVEIYTIVLNRLGKEHGVHTGKDSGRTRLVTCTLAANVSKSRQTQLLQFVSFQTFTKSCRSETWVICDVSYSESCISLSQSVCTS